MCKKSIKKKDKARELIKENQEIFKCPVCNGSMSINDTNSLTCDSNHCFDLSKKGYINLLTSSNIPSYSKELFQARNKVCEAGFYDLLIDKLVKIIREYQKTINKEEVNILDAGCGEGSHIYSIYEKLEADKKNNFIGIDISKDSINIAASNNADIIWGVADLARLPFQNRSLDIVLNILSPANYGEFHRILSDDGIVIKVVPNSQYLKELREIVYKSNENATYSNDKVINHFQEKLDVIDIQNINYKFHISKGFLPYLIKMTPLTWGESAEKLNSILENDISYITVDLDIIIGRKKN